MNLKVKETIAKILSIIPRDYGGYVKNLNTLYDTGWGYTNSATGQPPNVSNGTVLVFRMGTVTTQIYIPYSYASIYARTYIGSWQNWKQL